MTRPEKTLPDYLRPGLELVSIGINPSLYSVEKGFAFARPGNRFWPAFNAAGFVPEPLLPGRPAVEMLFRTHGIGFTDIVKRPTRSAAELTRDDFVRGARRLRLKLERHRPRIAWFQGRDAWKMFLEHALQDRHPFDLGVQPERIGATWVYVTPNPSGANPAANPKALRAHFVALRQFHKSIVNS